MKSNSVRFFSSGIGLIEVLITTVVIALGLLAVARFQVGVIGESRDNKAMVEAKNYCESGIEDLRRLMSRTDFIAFQEDLNPLQEEFAGKSAVFRRTLRVENLPDPGVTTNDIAREKRVTATCAWDDGDVVLQTVLSLHGANSSALAAGLGGSGGPAISPSLNAGSSDDISEIVSIPPNVGEVTAGEVISFGGGLYVVQPNLQNAASSTLCSALLPNEPAPFENGLRARRVEKDGLPGAEIIELFEVVEDQDGNDVCIPRVQYNGGVVVPIRGIVHSRITPKPGESFLPVELFTLSVSESGAYCVFKPAPGLTSAPYTCYVGGNCAHGPDSVGLDDSDITQCPRDRIAGLLDNVGEGGWRGRLGLLNVASRDLNVCFSEEVNSVAETTRDTARSYFSYNVGMDGVVGGSDDRSQGINKSYFCHDFLIVNGVANDKQLRESCIAEAATVGGLKMASKSISRIIDTGVYDNPHDPVVDISSCSNIPGTKYTVTGTLVDQIGLPLVQVSDGPSTWDCDVANGTYSCTFTTLRDAVRIWSYFGETRYPAEPCIVVLDPLGSGCTIAFPEITEEISYLVEGSISGSGAVATDPLGGLRVLRVQYGNAISAGCSVGGLLDDKRTYTCAFVASEALTQVTLQAVPDTQYSLEEFVPVVQVQVPVDGDGGRLVTGPNLVIGSAQTRKLSGRIIVGPIGAGEFVVPAVNPTTSLGCTGPDTPAGGLGQNSEVEYDCIVTPAIDGVLASVTYSIPKVCSAYKNKNFPGYRYEIRVGEQASTEGGLDVDLDGMDMDKVVDVEITLTDIKCG